MLRIRDTGKATRIVPIIGRIIFILILVFSSLKFFADGGRFAISTDLKDLSPALSNAPDTQSAINTLSRYIEGKFSLIIVANSEEAVAGAVTMASALISELDGIELPAEGTLPQLVADLEQHRFHLLSARQKHRLTTGETAVMVNEAIRNLHLLSGSPQVLPLAQDPLGIFAEYLSSFINQLPSAASAPQSADRSGEILWFQALPLTITEGSLDIESQSRLTTSLDAINDSITTHYPVQILHSGVVFFAADAAEKSQQDIKLISMGSGLGVVLLLLLVFYSAYALLIPAISVCVGIFFAITMSQAIYGSIHVLTIVFGASLIGVIIDYSLHYFYHCGLSEENHELRSKLYTAMSVSLLTSLIGYGALSFSELDALKKIATFSCFGVIAAWIGVISAGSLAPAAPVPLSKHILSMVLSLLNKGIERVVKRSSFLRWTIVLLTCIGYLYFTGVPVNDSPRMFFNPSAELLAEENQASELVNDFEPGQYLIIKGSSTANVYLLYENFLEELAGKVSSEALFSVMGLLPSPAEQAANYRLQQRLYNIPGASSDFFKAIGSETENDSDPGPARRLQTEYQASKNRLLTADSLFTESRQLPPLWITIEDNIYSFILIDKGTATGALQAASQKFPEITYINTLELTQQALEAQRLSASGLLIVAYLLVSGLLIIIYRTFAILSLLLIPLSATAGTLMIFTWWQVDITLFNLMGFFLLLGLGMDYSIFCKEMVADMTVTQNAILLSALTTALSFGLLSISSVPVASAFGLTLLVGNTLNFIASLLYAGLLRKEDSK